MLYNINIWLWTKWFHTGDRTEGSRCRPVCARSTLEEINVPRGSVAWLGRGKLEARVPVLRGTRSRMGGTAGPEQFFLTKKPKIQGLIRSSRGQHLWVQARYRILQVLQIIEMCTKEEDWEWARKTDWWHRSASPMVTVGVAMPQSPGPARPSDSGKSTVFNLWHFLGFPQEHTLTNTALRLFTVSASGETEGFF